MQWSLFVLILMGQCSLFTCHLYEYHFIQKEKCWDEAQEYCREHYTDLATVSSMSDLKRLRNSSQTTDAWIGLHSISAERSWHWSLPGVEFKESEIKWASEQPNHHQSNENCVVIRGDKCHDFPCKDTFEFICYNESTQTYHCVNDAKNWLQAQSYCREHHTDLVSGIKHIKSAEFKKQDETCTEQIDSSENPDRNLWIGLFREIWSWSDGKNFSFRHWDPDSFTHDTDKGCAMMKSDGTWISDNCANLKPFYCYDDKVILINESKTWEEALDYCRENHHDLVSITDHHQQRWVEKRAKMADTEFIWLGMRYTCTLDLWFWVSDHLVCYDNWAPEDKTEQCDRATAMKRDGKWYEKADSEKFHFFCAK